MPKSDYTDFFALDPFFAVVMKGLSKFVDGEHYFDTLATDVLFEFFYDFPGWPRVTRGRDDLISLYSGYGNNIRLHRGRDGDLATRATNGGNRRGNISPCAWIPRRNPISLRYVRG